MSDANQGFTPEQQQAIVMTQGGNTAAEAKQYVAQLAKDKRYHKDVY